MKRNGRFQNISKWRQENPNYQNGAKNPSWKGGTSKSTICRLVKRILAGANIDQTTCFDCKSKCDAVRKRWDVHHIDHNRLNNVLDNLVVLCPSCHSIRHKDFHESRRDKKTGRYKCLE